MKQWVLVIKEMTGAQLESVVSTYSFVFNTPLNLNNVEHLKEALLNEPVCNDRNFAGYLVGKLNNGHYKVTEL